MLQPRWRAPGVTRRAVARVPHPDVRPARAYWRGEGRFVFGYAACCPAARDRPVILRWGRAAARGRRPLLAPATRRMIGDPQPDFVVAVARVVVVVAVRPAHVPRRKTLPPRHP